MGLHSRNQNNRANIVTKQDRLYLALYLPRWATDCLKRHDPQLALSLVPFVLYEREKSAMRIQALDEVAERNGLYVGQNLSDARALCPDLNAREIDRVFLETMFENFADWHSYTSPIVSIPDVRMPFGDLMIDITGVSHLFGGTRQMLTQVTGRLKREDFAVQGAIAPSIGGAWALAHFHPGQIVSEGEEETALAGLLAALPIVALRLEENQVRGLEQMGLKTIGQLYGRDRKALRSRFGETLISRIDQALGHLEERLVPRLPVPERQSERRFAEPIVLENDILMVVNDLAIQLCAQLEAEGLGAQSFHLFLFRVDYQVMHLGVNAARAIRASKHVTRLFTNRIDRLAGEFDAGFGIEAIRLAATSVSQLDPKQVGAFEIVDGVQDLDRLYDRMVSRLGPKAILRSKPVNSHLPERAVVLEPVIARTRDDPDALMSFEDGDPVSGVPSPPPARPLRLLPVPEQIKVMAEVPDGPPVRMVWRRLSYRLVKAGGPERIGVEWWQPGAGGLTRDYYSVEDETGRRFWVYREGLYVSETDEPRWFLHGFDA